MRLPQSDKSVSQLCDLLIYIPLSFHFNLHFLNQHVSTNTVCQCKMRWQFLFGVAQRYWGFRVASDLQRQATMKCFWAGSSNFSRNSFMRVFLNAQCKMHHDGFPLHGVIDSHLELMNKTSSMGSIFFETWSTLMPSVKKLPSPPHNFKINSLVFWQATHRTLEFQPS